MSYDDLFAPFMQFIKLTTFGILILENKISLNDKKFHVTNLCVNKDPNIFDGGYEDILSFESNVQALSVDDIGQRLLVTLPIIVPTIAFNTFEQTLNAFDNSLALLSDYLLSGSTNAILFDPMEAVSMNVENKIVLTSISLLFASIASITLNSLRQRILDIDIGLNNEGTLLQDLFTLVNSLVTTRATKISFLFYLESYSKRLIAESGSNVLNCNSTLYSELNVLFQDLIMLENKEKQDEASMKNTEVLSLMHESISQLKEHRNRRIALLRRNFPPWHYATLIFLAMNLCALFLADANSVKTVNDILLLKVYWAIIHSTFAIFTVTCLDLRDPFRGSYLVCTSPLHATKEKIERQRAHDEKMM